MYSNIQHGPVLLSPPSRGAWIEINQALTEMLLHVVAPLAGGVD